MGKTKWAKKYIPIKQKCISLFFHEHQRAIYEILKFGRSSTWADHHYHFLNLHPGRGMENGYLGSSLIFLRRAVTNPEAWYQCTFTEKNRKFCKELDSYKEDLYARRGLFEYEGRAKNLLDEAYFASLRKRIKIDILPGDPNVSIDKKYLTNPGDKKKLGMIFEDSALPDFELMARLAQHKIYSRMDVLINCNVACMKGIQTSCKQYKGLAGIEDLKKSFWLVGLPLFNHQWTWLYGTQYDDYRQKNKDSLSGIREYEETLGMYKVESEEGEAIIYYLSKTKKDRDYSKAVDEMKRLGLLEARSEFLNKIIASEEGDYYE